MEAEKDIVKRLVFACKVALEIIATQQDTINEITNIPFPTRFRFPSPPTGYIKDTISIAEAE